jgi:hypothetical protein
MKILKTIQFQDQEIALISDEATTEMPPSYYPPLPPFTAYVQLNIEIQNNDVMSFVNLFFANNYVGIFVKKRSYYCCKSNQEVKPGYLRFMKTVSHTVLHHCEYGISICFTIINATSKCFAAKRPLQKKSNNCPVTDFAEVRVA